VGGAVSSSAASSSIASGVSRATCARYAACASASRPAWKSQRAELAAVLVRDAVLAQQRAEPRLRHAGPARLRAEPDVDHAPHAGGLELGDERRRKQLLVADGPDGGYHDRPG
jgi:hypothetical protein